MIRSDEYNRLMIAPDASIFQALSQMDEIGFKLLLVSRQSKIENVVSVGDIQRAILRGVDLKSEIEGLLRSDSILSTVDMSKQDIKDLMIKHRMEYCPVIDDHGRLISVHFWEDLFSQELMPKYGAFDLPVVIMAGGLGTRMRPITNVIPKPLIPIKDKTILEEIVSRYKVHGCSTYYITVNFKAHIIEYYLNEKPIEGCSVELVLEEDPLGTAGSLRLLKDRLTDTFFVNNCDILIDEDYSAILDYHNSSKNTITVVSALKNYNIPYGTLETSVNGEFVSLSEKPVYTFQVNSGLYIIEPHALDLIPVGKVYHLTDLLRDVYNQGERVGVYPVSGNSWQDIGNWDSYLELIEKG